MNALYAIDVRGPACLHWQRMHRTPSEYDALRLAHLWDQCAQRGWQTRIIAPAGNCIVEKGR